MLRRIRTRAGLKQGASQDPNNRDVEQLGLIPIYRDSAQPDTSRLSGSCEAPCLRPALVRIRRSILGKIYLIICVIHRTQTLYARSGPGA